MGNMSYCRFQNTLGDLRDCQEAMDMDEADDLSEEEERARRALIRACCEIASDHGDDARSARRVRDA